MASHALCTLINVVFWSPKEGSHFKRSTVELEVS